MWEWGCGSGGVGVGMGDPSLVPRLFLAERKDEPGDKARKTPRRVRRVWEGRPRESGGWGKEDFRRYSTTSWHPIFSATSQKSCSDIHISAARCSHAQ